MSTQRPKLRDHVGLLQDQFENLLMKMFDSIESIQSDAVSEPGSKEQSQKFEELTQKAEDIVKCVKQIDALIDEAEKDTCIGENETDILRKLNEHSEEYEEDVRSLTGKCEQANKWLGRIKNLLNVMAENTPWMSNNQSTE